MFQASPCCLVPLAGLAEVEAAEKFAHKQNVGAVDDLRAQRAVDGQFFECEGGAQIGEAAESRANGQQASFGTLVGGKELNSLPPTAPRRTASEARAAASVSAGSGVPS